MASFVPPVTFTVEANAQNFNSTFDGVKEKLKETGTVADKTSKSMQNFEKQTQRTTSAVRALTLIKAAFVAYGVREILNLETAFNNLGGALAAVGISTGETRQKAQQIAESLQKLGFDSADAANGLASLVTATGDLAKSERLLGIAANYARVQHVGLEDASRAVLAASRGNAKVFNQFGITLDTSVSKAEALKKAMTELEARLGDRAKNATQTLAVQLQILKQQLIGFVETVAAYAVPWITKFVSAIITATQWLKEHKEALYVVAGIMTTLLLTAIVNITRALYAQAAAWIAANGTIALIVAAVLAAAAGFVYLWNKFKGFRDGVITYGQALITYWSGLAQIILLFAETAVMAFSLAMNAFLIFVRGTANAQIALGKLFRNEEMQRRGKETLDWIDSANAAVTGFGNKLVGARDAIAKFASDLKTKLASFKDVKIDLSKFKLPKFEIPKFENGNTLGEQIAQDIQDGLRKAKLYIAEFNRDLAKSFGKATATWASIVNRDYQGEIARKSDPSYNGLLQGAMDATKAYIDVNNKYKGSVKDLTKAQDAYIAAVRTGQQAAIDAAKSSLTAAEEATVGILDNIQGALEDIKRIQDDMIDKIVESNKRIAELEEQRTKVLKEAQKEREALEKDYNKQVAALRKQYNKDVVNAQLDAAKRSREIVKQSIDQLRGIFRSGTYRSLSDIYSSITYEGRYLKGGTIQKILKNLGLQAGKAQLLAADAAQLAALGFSQTFIEEVVSLGPDMGHTLAQTILQAGPESIAQLQTYWTQLQTISQHGVDGIAKSLNTGIVLATEELTQQLADVQTELAETLKNLDSELAESLKEAFTSYSEALEAINSRTAETIAEIDAEITKLNGLIAQLAAALATLAKLPAPGVKVDPSGFEAALAAAKAEADAAAELARAQAAAKDAADALAESEAALAAINAALAANNATSANANKVIAQSTLNAWRKGEIASSNFNTTINVTTNATAAAIAREYGWAVRTSGDVILTAGAATAQDSGSLAMP